MLDEVDLFLCVLRYSTDATSQTLLSFHAFFLFLSQPCLCIFAGSISPSDQDLEDAFSLCQSISKPIQVISKDLAPSS